MSFVVLTEPCMKPSCWCSSEVNQYGDQKIMLTYFGYLGH